jgi:hypothetical protein
MMRRCWSCYCAGCLSPGEERGACCPLCTIVASVLDSRQDAAGNAAVWWTCSFGLGQSLVVKDVGSAASGLDPLLRQLRIAVRNDLLPVYAQERTGNTI